MSAKSTYLIYTSIQSDQYQKQKDGANWEQMVVPNKIFPRRYRILLAVRESPFLQMSPFVNMVIVTSLQWINNEWNPQ